VTIDLVELDPELLFCLFRVHIRVDVTLFDDQISQNKVLQTLKQNTSQ
jgi:hypothetical protein